jgi:hypothetical protein
MHGSKIRKVIDRYLITAAYLVMIAGLTIRAVALVVSAGFPYDAWPVLLRVAIEVVAALGMVVASEILLSAAASSYAAMGRQLAQIANDPRFLARPTSKHYQAEQAAKDKQREAALLPIVAERRGQLRAVLFYGSITVAYGGLFALTTLSRADWRTIAAEVIGVVAVPFINWYISAGYQPEQHDPQQTARAIAESAVDARLQSARARFAEGQETPEDIRLLRKANEGNGYHTSLVAALAAPPEHTVSYSASEVYTLLGITSPSKRATVRRRIRTAGEREMDGVYRDPESNEWRLTPTAFMQLFEDMIAVPPIPGRSPSTPRTKQGHEPAKIADIGERRASTRRAQGEQLTATSTTITADPPSDPSPVATGTTR